MNIFRKIKKSKTWENHKESIFFLLTVFFFSFLPVWLTLLVMIFTGSWLNVNYIWDNGEFFIYSAALLGSSFYMMSEFSKKPGFLELSSSVLIIISAASFTIITIPNLLQVELEIKSQIIAIMSFIVVSFSIFIICCAHYLTLRKIDPNAKNRESQKKIIARLK